MLFTSIAVTLLRRPQRGFCDVSQEKTPAHVLIGPLPVFHSLVFKDGLKIFDSVQKLFELSGLFLVESDAFAHALMLGSPVTDIKLRFSAVPGDLVQFLGPAAGVLRKDAKFFRDLISEFRPNSSL